MLTFGERLKRARERADMTQLDVSRRIGITTKSLSRYETNASSPDPETITELCRVYDVSVAYIMGLSYEMGRCEESASGSSAFSNNDIHETIETLSQDSRQKAEDYISMLKTLEDIKFGDDVIDTQKNA